MVIVYLNTCQSEPVSEARPPAAVKVGVTERHYEALLSRETHESAGVSD